MGCSPRCSSRGLPAVRQSCQRWGCIGATTWACAPGCLLGGALLLASLARLELQLWCCPAAACCPHRCPPAPRLHLCPHRCPPGRPSSAPLSSPLPARPPLICTSAAASTSPATRRSTSEAAAWRVSKLVTQHTRQPASPCATLEAGSGHAGPAAQLPSLSRLPVLHNCTNSTKATIPPTQPCPLHMIAAPPPPAQPPPMQLRPVFPPQIRLEPWPLV